MCEAEIAARRKHRRVLTTKRDATHPVAAKVLNRECTATEPNTKWVTDSTSIPTTRGKRFEYGSVSSPSQGGEARITVIADVNTPAEQARKRLEQMAAVGSQSRKGKCWDNAAMESVRR
jgi:putative transposase